MRWGEREEERETEGIASAMALSSVIIFEFSDLNIIIKSFYFLKALRSTGPAVAHLRPLSLLASSKAGGKVSLDTCSHSHLDHANF